MHSVLECDTAGNQLRVKIPLQPHNAYLNETGASLYITGGSQKPILYYLASEMIIIRGVSCTEIGVKHNSIKYSEQ